MPTQGWQRLAAGLRAVVSGRWKLFDRGLFRVHAAAAAGRKPCGTDGAGPLDAADPWGWQVTRIRRSARIAAGAGACRRTSFCTRCSTSATAGRRTASHEAKLRGNPYWPPELAGGPARCRTSATWCCCRWPCRRRRTTRAASAGRSSAAASRGRRARSGGDSSTAPRTRIAGRAGARLLPPAAGGRLRRAAGGWPICAAAGFRILPSAGDAAAALLGRGAAALVDGALSAGTRASRFAAVQLPADVPPLRPAAGRGAPGVSGRRFAPAAFSGQPLFSARRRTCSCRRELPLAVQIPLLHSLQRHEAPRGIRVPQSGWLHEPRPDQPAPARRLRPAAQHASAARTAGPASIATRTSWPCCRRRRPRGPRAVQRRPPTTWAFTASRWPATRKSGRTISTCCWTARGRRPRQLARGGRAAAPRADMFGYRFLYPPMRSAGTRSFGIARWSPTSRRRRPSRRCCPTRRWDI